MPLFTLSQRRLAAAISRLAFGNPFAAERRDDERAILGQASSGNGSIVSVAAFRRDEGYHGQRIAQLNAELVNGARQRLADGASAGDQELELYADAVLHHLFAEFNVELQKLVDGAHAGRASPRVTIWRRFGAALDAFLEPAARALPIQHDAAHLLAYFFQMQRAQFHASSFVIGHSPSADRLRAAVWQSLFTHNQRRYLRSLYQHIGDVPTLIVAPAGADAEPVARAVGLSRYVPFDAERSRFAENFADVFLTLNLNSYLPELVDSALFGHRRGAVAGAVADRSGWLEACSPHGALFLDEIVELPLPTQGRLLRVLRSRTFERLGDSAPRAFAGKIVAATQCDPASSLRSGLLREDLVQALGVDRIEMATLREQLDECPEDLDRLLTAIARRTAPAEAESLAGDVAQWIHRHLPPGYPWRGDRRELEQCFASVIVCGEYLPLHATAGVRDGRAATAEAMHQGVLTADELLRRYCRIVYEQCGSYEETARRLALDRRTVKSRLQQPVEREASAVAEQRAVTLASRAPSE